MWQKYFSSFLLCYTLLTAGAQSTTGITGKVDTSYSTNTAFENTQKTHPNIKIVFQKHPKTVREKRNIEYCKISERSLIMDAFYPAAKSKIPKPAILIIHGGGWRTGNRTQHYPLAEKLAEAGYICYTPEYRLSTEALYPAAVNDLKSALKWMRANAPRENIDTTKIAVLGFSAGGELATFLGTTANNPTFEQNTCNGATSTSVQAIVDLDGTLSFVHPESAEGDDSRSTSAATYWFGYSKKDNPQLWQDASPLAHVGKNTPPTLFVNSAVPWMHAGREDYIKVLNDNNIYSEVHTFPNAPHSFVLFEPWFDPTVNYITGFLNKVFNYSWKQ